MRTIVTIFAAWATCAAAAVIAIGRIVGVLPDPPPLPVDYLADQPVDVWSDTRIDAEFWALVWPYEVRS